MNTSCRLSATTAWDGMPSPGGIKTFKLWFSSVCLRRSVHSRFKWRRLELLQNGSTGNEPCNAAETQNGRRRPLWGPRPQLTSELSNYLAGIEPGVVFSAPWPLPPMAPAPAPPAAPVLPVVPVELSPPVVPGMVAAPPEVPPFIPMLALPVRAEAEPLMLFCPPSFLDVDVAVPVVAVEPCLEFSPPVAFWANAGEAPSAATQARVAAAVRDLTFMRVSDWLKTSP